jgi:outer membrane protein TolC
MRPSPWTSPRRAALASSALLLLGSALGAQTSIDAEAPSLTLRQAVELAMSQHIAVAAEAEKVVQAEIDVELARQLGRPDIRFEARTGLVPEARGDIFDSPDSNNDLDGLGVFWRFEVGLIQPISTFGKIPSARRAAESAVRLREHGRREMAENLGFEVVRGFWLLESARRAGEFAEGLEEDYRQLIPEVEAAVEDEASDVDHTDLFEVESVEYGIVQTLEQTIEAQRFAVAYLESLLELSGLEPTSIAAVETPGLPADEEWSDPLEALALRSNPTLEQARSGIDAQTEKISLFEAEKRPDLFLALGATYARAPNRTDQENPFIFDPFNLRTVGAFVGLQWDLNFKRHELRLRQTRSELEQFQHQVGVLEQKTSLEVTRALAEARASSMLLAAARRSLKSAKSWVRLSGDNWDLGIGKVKRLIDAYERYYELTIVEVEREAAYHIALARLARALGDVRLYLEWTENGNVSIR